MNENIITIRKHDISQASVAFAEFMSLTESCLNTRAQSEPRSYANLNASALEQLSVNIMREIAPSTPFRDTDIQLVSGQSFPDIMAGEYYGVEVKSTKANHWTSTGSSIVESTRNATVEEIYLLFGKLGGTPPEFRCRPYQDCLYDITVTHSPRYLIDMELTEEQTIFHKMGTTYDQLRTSSDSIAKVRSYYKQKALIENKKEMPWWISTEEDESSGVMGINLRHYSTLSIEERNNLKCQCVILFPALICSTDKDKYTDIALWLCTYNGVLNGNVRDMFSAGGQVKYIDNKLLARPLPAFIKNFVNNATKIKQMLSVPNIYKLIRPIRENNPAILNGGIDNAFESWAQMVDTIINNQLGLQGIPKVEIHNWMTKGWELSR